MLISIVCFTVVLKRLDDVSDEVRLLALDVVSVFPAVLGSETKEEEERFLEQVYKVLLVHVDDKNGEVRRKVAGTRTILAHKLAGTTFQNHSPH